jgi:hypothetical protein
VGDVKLIEKKVATHAGFDSGFFKMRVEYYNGVTDNGTRGVFVRGI